MEECGAGMGSTAEGAGKPTAQDVFAAAFSSRRRSREDDGCSSTELLLVSSCPESWLGKSGSSLKPCSAPGAAGGCERWHPAMLHCSCQLPPQSGWERSCLPFEVSSAVALLPEVRLYLLRVQPCFIELFHEA